MAKKSPKPDYEGWVMRLIDKIEDLKFTFNLREWLEFAQNKIMPKQQYELTSDQIAVLDGKRDFLREEIPSKLKINPEYVIKYRSVRSGRFVGRTPYGFRDKNGRFTKANSERAIRYRNIGRGYQQGDGTFVLPGKINRAITELKTAKEWDKA